MRFLQKYWDIFSGIIAGILLSFIAKFELETVQLYYSIAILILVCIGAMRIVKQAIEKQLHTRERKHNIIDSMVDGQKSVKAIRIAQTPTKEGEKIGELIILVLKGIKKTMEKFRSFFSKFKGYMLTTALAILTVIEMCSGSINSLFGGTLAINGIAVLPIVTLVLTAIVGALSNGFDKDQNEKIKALFSKSTTNEIVIAEIKKTIKEKTAQHAQFNKVLTTQQHELANFESELDALNKTLEAKREMRAMIPQLATDADVQLAATEVSNCNAKIATAKEEVAKTTSMIDTLTKTINALKSQL